MRTISRRLASAVFALTAIPMMLSAPAPAQTWPQRTVKFIVPLGPGSGADISARLIAERLTKKWGQPVIIENRPGAEGVIAINAVLNARDDHMLLFGPSSSYVGHPYTLEKVPYNQRDLKPIARVSSTLVSVGVTPKLNVNSLKELFDLARAKPGEYNWTTITGVTDIIVGGFMKKAGLDMVRLRYRDPVSAVTDVAEGRVHLYVAAFAISRGPAAAGRLKLVAMTNRERAPVRPDLPTVAEAGFPELSFDGNVGVFGPPNVPIDLRERIAADVTEVLSDPEVVKRLEATGQLIRPGGAAEFAAAIEDQAAKLKETAAVLGIKPKM
jgi:tripartite-type tricarboxylate transporter receptor subunit TctC